MGGHCVSCIVYSVCKQGDYGWGIYAIRNGESYYVVSIILTSMLLTTITFISTYGKELLCISFFALYNKTLN